MIYTISHIMQYFRRADKNTIKKRYAHVKDINIPIFWQSATPAPHFEHQTCWEIPISNAMAIFLVACNSAKMHSTYYTYYTMHLCSYFVAVRFSSIPYLSIQSGIVPKRAFNRKLLDEFVSISHIYTTRSAHLYNNNDYNIHTDNICIYRYACALLGSLGAQRMELRHRETHTDYIFLHIVYTVFSILYEMSYCIPCNAWPQILTHIYISGNSSGSASIRESLPSSLQCAANAWVYRFRSQI